MIIDLLLNRCWKALGLRICSCLLGSNLQGPLYEKPIRLAIMASSSKTPPSEPASYTAMDKDVEAIGAHCQYSYCNQLDFLPFRCQSCRGTYCLDHRTETSHKCERAGEWAAAKRKAAGLFPSSNAPSGGKPTLHMATQCWHTSCKTYINTLNSIGVRCPTCNRQYCLKHRLQEDHTCTTVVPIGAVPSQTQSIDKAKAALGRLRVWGKEKQAAILPKPKPSTAASRIVALNALRKTAKGDEKIPSNKRIYLHVEAEAHTTTSKLPRGEFWYSWEWSVGRVLDAAAKGLQVQNMNNRGGGEEEKLRVYHVEGGRMLEFGEKIGDTVVDGNTLVLLRGVGPIMTDLDKVWRRLSYLRLSAFPFLPQCSGNLLFRHSDGVRNESLSLSCSARAIVFWHSMLTVIWMANKQVGKALQILYSTTVESICNDSFYIPFVLCTRSSDSLSSLHLLRLYHHTSNDFLYPLCLELCALALSAPWRHPPKLTKSFQDACFLRISVG